MRKASEGNYKDGLDNNKKSPWNDDETMFNNKKKVHTTTFLWRKE